MPFSAPVLTYRAKALASNMCSKVLNGHIILTDTSITTILAPEMTYTPKISGKVIRESRIDLTEFMKYGEPKVQSEIFDESESRYRSLKKCYNADATKTENSTSDGADRKSLHEKSSISNLQTL